MGALPRSVTQLKTSLEARLVAALTGARWNVDVIETPEAAPLLRIERGPSILIAGFGVASASRQRELSALLADAWLRAHHYANSLNLPAQPLAIVGAPSLSRNMVRSLETYAETYLPNRGWGFVDASGRLEVHAPGLTLREGPHARVRMMSSAAPVDLFSDLGQWVLKSLVAPALDPNLISGPHERPETARDLACLADVSVPTATRLVRRLREDGFLEERGPLHLLEPEKLLKRWQGMGRDPAEVRYRWLFPPTDSKQQLVRQLGRYAANRVVGGDNKSWRAGPRACLGLFAACDQLGIGIVRGVAPHLYVEDPSTLEELGLHPAGAGEPADVLVRFARTPESLFRGNVFPDGVPTADVIQCYLDLAEHPARGGEQAAYLSRILAPSLGFDS